MLVEVLKQSVTHHLRRILVDAAQPCLIFRREDVDISTSPCRCNRATVNLNGIAIFVVISSRLAVVGATVWPHKEVVEALSRFLQWASGKLILKLWHDRGLKIFNSFRRVQVDYV